MLKRVTILLLVCIVLVIMGSCRKESPTEPEEEVIIDENTKIPEENANLTGVIINGNTLSLIYKSGSSKPTFNNGNIVVGQMAGGYLKKILSSTVKGDTIVLVTEQSALTDAVKKGSIDTTFSLSPESMKIKPIEIDTTYQDKYSEKYHLYIVSETPRCYPARNGELFEIRIPNVQLEIRDSNNELAVSLNIDTLVLKKSLDIDLEIVINLSEITKFKLIGSSTDEVDFKNVSIDFKKSISSGIETKLITVHLGQIIFWIGPVPVVFVFELGVYGGIEAAVTVNVSSQLSNNVTVTSTDTVGSIYEDNSWSPIFEKTLNGNANFSFNPSASISASLDNFLKGSVDAKMYGVLGPSFYVKSYQYNEVSYPPIDYELGVGIGAGVAFKVEILSWALAEFNYEFIDYKIPLYHSTNNPPNTPSTPSGPSSGDIGVSYDFSSSATDPDGDSIAIRFSWGDGDTSSWSSYVPSGNAVTMDHSWSSSGTYYVKAQAKDVNGAMSGWSNAHQINISGGGEWVKTDIGSTEQVWCVAVGDGRGDGKSRVYGGSWNCMLEFEWYDGTWIETNMGSTGNVLDVAVGDGRGDGKPRVYSGLNGFWLLEFTWDGSSWVETTVGIAGSDFIDVAIGDGRGDGKSRVYSGSRDTHLYEFEWTGSSWVKTDMGSFGDDVVDVALGDGRGDGKPRVYAAVWDGHLYEFEWTGSSWVKTDMGLVGDCSHAIALGDGKGDGKPRIYSGCWDHHLYEFEWNGSSWVIIDMGSGGDYMDDVAVGDGRGDGKPRVYCTNYDDYLYEFEWTGSNGFDFSHR